jgi:paraquat-inducible protein B
MGKKANPAVIGAFVVGAMALVIAGLVVFGGGRFLRDTAAFVLYFDESVKGLNLGAPVTFNGVRVGRVTDILVVVDRMQNRIQTPVFIELEARRFTDAAGGKFKFRMDDSGGKLMIQQGLRAQLELQSFVTGQLVVAMDFHPGTPVRMTGLTPDMEELPTIPSSTEKLTRTLENIPIEEISQAILRTVNDIDGFVSSPELKETVPLLNAALKQVQQLARNVDREVGPLAARLDATLESAQGAVGDVRTLVRRLDSQTVPLLNDTLRDADSLARHIDGQVGPVAEGLVKTLETAQALLERSRHAVASVDEAVADGSPLRHELTRSLRELSAAARSIRHLSEYLERHPDAVVFGKRDEGGQ